MTIVEGVGGSSPLCRGSTTALEGTPPPEERNTSTDTHSAVTSCARACGQAALGALFSAGDRRAFKILSKRLNRFLVQIVRNAGAPKLNSNGVPLLLRPHYPSWGLWMRVHQAYSSALAFVHIAGNIKPKNARTRNAHINSAVV